MSATQNKTFLQCELVFFFYLIIGLILLNIIGLVFQNIFNTALLISISTSVFVVALYILYFLYGFVKFYILKNEFTCKNFKERLASWLSSLT